MTTLTLTLGPGGGIPLKVGPVTLTGQLTGSFSATVFTVDGTGSIALQGEGTFSATIHIDKHGAWACDGSAKGFSWTWGQSLPVLQPAGHCVPTP